MLAQKLAAIPYPFMLSPPEQRTQSDWTPKYILMYSQLVHFLGIGNTPL